jgi:hypothetical protein
MKKGVGSGVGSKVGSGSGSRSRSAPKCHGSPTLADFYLPLQRLEEGAGGRQPSVRTAFSTYGVPVRTKTNFTQRFFKLTACLRAISF